MRWYVNRSGQTVGPLDEANIMHWAQTGQITRGMSFQAETGGPWMPVEQSPFARYVAQAPAQRLPAKGLPAWLWVVLLASPVALFALLGALPEAKLPARPLSATPAAVPQQVTPAKDPSTWFQFSEIRELGKVRTRHAKPTSVDDSGSRLKLENYEVTGFAVTTLAIKRSDESAWKIHAEALGKRLCSPENWAPNARLYRDDGELPLSAKWFDLDGGPLTGLVVKAFVNDSNPCVLHFATREYAQAEGWPLP